MYSSSNTSYKQNFSRQYLTGNFYILPIILYFAIGTCTGSMNFNMNSPLVRCVSITRLYIIIHSENDFK